MPDLIPERVIRWNGVGLGRIDIDAQDLPKQCIQRLCIPKWISACASIPKPGIQITIRPKGHHATIMIWEGLFYSKQDHFTVWVCCISAGLKARKECVASRASIVDVEESILGVIGMKSQTQQTHFIVVIVHAVFNINERRFTYLSTLE